MFLRFTVSERDSESQSWKGLFSAAYALRDDGGLSASETAQVQEMIEWFKEHLPVPGCFRWLKQPRAICWFTPDAGEPLTRMWRLVKFLENRGVAVRLYKTHDPGMRVYTDKYQVVAVPHKKGLEVRRSR